MESVNISSTQQITVEHLGFVTITLTGDEVTKERNIFTPPRDLGTVEETPERIII